MTELTASPWAAVERRAPALFLAAGALLIVAAVYYAGPLLFENVEFSSWVGLTVLVGRLVTLLGIAGLTVLLADRTPRAGRLTGVIVALTIIVTSGLLSLAVLENLGVSVPVIAVFGIGTIVLSIITYALVGTLILRTGVHSPLIGGLLLAATGGLLFGFFGQAALSEAIVGTVTESVLSVTSLVIGYRLRTAVETPSQSDVASETSPR